ncbi:MAG: amidohydrolase family protein [Betaproteobacteria bacterium]|nr:amidohydrolase family protein [Betaproteobacteria bacterium]
MADDFASNFNRNTLLSTTYRWRDLDGNNNYTPGEVKLVAPIAERHPGLKLVIDHMAIPRGAKDEAAFAHIDELCSFARFANVAVKVTSLPSYSDEAYPHPKLHKYVRRMYDAFGPRRLFWGSDLTRMLCSYRLCKTMFTEEMRWMTGDDLEWIMGRGVCEWLGWPLQA